MQGRVKNTENLRTCSIVGCVKIDPKFHFLQKFPVFPCFFMILAVLIVSWVQVFHKPKVKDSLHRHNKKSRPAGVFFIVFDNVDSNPGARVRTAAKRRTGVRRFARMRKFCQVMKRSEIIPSSPPGIIKCPPAGHFVIPSETKRREHIAMARTGWYTPGGTWYFL